MRSFLAKRRHDMSRRDYGFSANSCGESPEMHGSPQLILKYRRYRLLTRQIARLCVCIPDCALGRAGSAPPGYISIKVLGDRVFEPQRFFLMEIVRLKSGWASA